MSIKKGAARQLLLDGRSQQRGFGGINEVSPTPPIFLWVGGKPAGHGTTVLAVVGGRRHPLGWEVIELGNRS